MGEQNKYERERVRQIQRGGIQVKESAQIYRGKTKRSNIEGGRKGWWAKGKGQKSVSMMERGRVREAVTCEWFPKCAVAGDCQRRGKQKRERGDNLLPMWHDVKGVVCLAWHSAVVLNPALGDLSPPNLLILIIITVIIIIITLISATVNSTHRVAGQWGAGVILRRWKLSKYCWKEV